MPIGVVAVGYADGVHRCLPNGTPVLVGATRVPLAGRVSMDMITIDLRDAPHAKVGDPVRIWGGPARGRDRRATRARCPTSCSAASRSASTSASEAQVP